ncbi:hypothetical protein ABD77_13825 [Brevibacillus formosus]|nr:hypothetical protein [Brevibacillus formosus]
MNVNKYLDKQLEANGARTKHCKIILIQFEKAYNGENYRSCLFCFQHFATSDSPMEPYRFSYYFDRIKVEIRKQVIG